MHITIHSSTGQQGPFDVAQIKQLLSSGQVAYTDLGWTEGMTEWKPLSAFPELQASPSLPPPSEACASPAVPAPPSTEPKAIWSLVLGVLSLVMCGFLTGIPAIILGHIARAKIRKNVALNGAGMALAGLITGYTSVAITFIAVIAAIALPAILNLASAEVSAKETDAPNKSTGVAAKDTSVPPKSAPNTSTGSMRAQQRVASTNPIVDGAEPNENLKRVAKVMEGTWTYAKVPFKETLHPLGNSYPGVDLNYWIKIVVNADGQFSLYQGHTDWPNWGKPNVTSWTGGTDKYASSGTRYYYIETDSADNFFIYALIYLSNDRLRLIRKSTARPIGSPGDWDLELERGDAFPFSR